MGKIYMIGSQKGGTAKTTTTFNLAYCLRKMGKRVLAVDFDSQANLTTCFGVEDTGVLEDTVGHLMMAQIEDGKMPSPKRYIRTKDVVKFAWLSKSTARTRFPIFRRQYARLNVVVVLAVPPFCEPIIYIFPILNTSLSSPQPCSTAAPQTHQYNPLSPSEQ